MRYFFEIAYNGARYHGWQNQHNAIGVQQLVEEGLSKIFRQKIAITGSGRTDAGVHCAQQFFHVDLEKTFDPDKLRQQMNSFLPADIAIGAIRAVKPDAHARYDARERTYEYHLTTKKNPLLVGRAYYCFKPLDFEKMNAAAALLTGEHDFECFSKVKTDVNHFICDLKLARWNQKGDLWVFTISANRFLRGMVRAIVGTLLEVGSGKMTVNQVKQILESRDRKKAGMNVPPEGLYLMSVKYPREIFLK
jgi:tRNA pseudouridine38-40 synthase